MTQHNNKTVMAFMHDCVCLRNLLD